MLATRTMSQPRSAAPEGGSALNVNHVTVVGSLVDPMQVVSSSLLTLRLAVKRCDQTYVHHVVVRGAQARACIHQSRYFQAGHQVLVSGSLERQVLPGRGRDVVVVARVVEPRPLVESEARGGGTPVSETAFGRSATGGSCEAFLLGVVHDAPTTVVTRGGQMVTKFRLATSGTCGVSLHDISVYDVRAAGACAQQLAVGRQVRVGGWVRPVIVAGADGPSRRIDVVADQVQPRHPRVAVAGEPAS